VAGVASLESDNLVVIYYLGASEIWLDERGDLWWEWPYKRGTTIYYFTIFSLTPQQQLLL